MKARNQSFNGTVDPSAETPAGPRPICFHHRRKTSWDPILTYQTGANSNCSVTGGYVYRGMAIPNMQGHYLFGDFCSGRIWGGVEDVTGSWSREEVLSSGLGISSFGEDEDGEIYVLDIGGGVYRLELFAAPTAIVEPVAGTVLPAAGTVNVISVPGLTCPPL